ncbi:MAG: hypothetical protein ACJ74I_11485 [Gaiellaceae bacterium]
MGPGGNGARRWAQALAVFALVAAFVGGGAGAMTAGCTATGVCVTTSHRPDAVSASSATTTRFVAEDTSLTNHSGNKLSLVEFHQTIPPGFAFVKDSLGACTAATGSVTCRHGLIVEGQTVANTLVYQTPVLGAGSEQTVAFAGKWCWAGCESHNSGATRVDSIDVSEPTTVIARSGFDATYVLAGAEADLATGGAASATDSLAGTWTIPGQPNDLPATAKEKPNPPGFQACPADGKPCRSGSWFGALSPGTTSFTPYSLVVYTQYKSLIPSGTTAANYQVVYTPCLPGDDPAHPAGCDVVRLPRCASASDLRCTEFVQKIAGGSYRVGVRIGSHNGYMM